MNCFRFLLIIFLSTQFLTAGNGTIKGTVKDKLTDDPLPGVNVLIVDTDKGTSTDLNGQYTIFNVKPGHYRIKASYIGYAEIIVRDVLVKVDSVIQIDFWLEPLAVEGEAIVVEGGKSDNRDKSERSEAGSRTSYRVNNDKKKEKRVTPKEELFSDLPPPPPVEEKPGVVISEPAPNKIPGFSGLKAGFADDNAQFNYFLNFLDEYREGIEYYPIRIEERIQLKVLDREGKPAPNAGMTITSDGKTVLTGKTYADGSFFIFPQQSKISTKSFEAGINYQNMNKKVNIEREGPRLIKINLGTGRTTFQQIPLDLLFILDVTGSMGEELDRLKTSIEIINLNIAALNIKPNIRFGLVCYRDRDDDFVTKLIPFTSDLQTFQKEINKLEAAGGGDDPEDLQSALKDAVQKMDWNEQGIRLAFIITDAATHLDYDQKYTYVHAAEEAKTKGIKIFSVGTGGLSIEGEYILRQISQYTYGKYIFLTYGEEGESEGGRPGSVSHHTGSNFQTDKLEAIIIRFAKEELSHLSDMEIAEDERYIQAVSVDFEEKEETVEKLFVTAIDELWDYSSIALPSPLNLSIIPLTVDRESLESTAEYFTERLHLAVSGMAGINLIERKDLQYIAGELEVQLSGIVEVNDAAKLGQWIGADYQIIGNLYFRDGNYEAYLKLVRVNTAEILSVTKLCIDYRLGL